MYKKASKLKIRFRTPKGLLSVENLWDLSLDDLASSIRLVNAELKKESSESGLDFLTTPEKDPINELRFTILKDIYVTRQESIEEEKSAREIKENNKKIIAIIAEKKEGALKDKSIEELEKMIIE